MARLWFLWLCVLGMAVFPARVAAQSAALPILDQRLIDRRLELIVHCAQADPSFDLHVADRQLTPVLQAATLTPTVIFLIEAGSAMDAAGTPGRTRRADSLALTLLALERMPPDSYAGVIFYSDNAERLSEPSAPALLRQALAGTASATESVSTAGFAAALTLALDDLAQAAPGPRLLVIAAATPLELPDGAAPAGLPKLLIDLSQSGDEQAPLVAMAEALGGAYLAHGTADPALIAQRVAAIVRAFDAAQHSAAYYRLSSELPAGLHGLQKIALRGCGQQLSSTIELGPPATNWPWPALLLLPAPVLGLLLWRRSQRAAPKARALLNAPALPVIGSGPGNGYYLEIWDGNRRSTLPCNGSQWVIGRAARCDIQIDHPWLSQAHVRISVSGDTLQITDLDSANGTLVGSERRRLLADQAEPLEPGEPIIFGAQLTAIVRRDPQAERN